MFIDSNGNEISAPMDGRFILVSRDITVDGNISSNLIKYQPREHHIDLDSPYYRVALSSKQTRV